MLVSIGGGEAGTRGEREYLGQVTPAPPIRPSHFVWLGCQWGAESLPTEPQWRRRPGPLQLQSA